MVATAAQSTTRGKKRYILTKLTTTIDVGPGGAMLESLYCSASASGTISFADTDGTITAVALALVAGTRYVFETPIRGVLTITGAGTSYSATLVIRD